MEGKFFDLWIAWNAVRFPEMPALVAYREAHEAARLHRRPPADMRVRDGFKSALERALVAAENDTVDIGNIPRIVAEKIGGMVMLKFLSGSRTYVGGAGQMLAGVAAIATALAGFMGMLNSGDVAGITGMQWWAAVVAGAGLIGNGLSSIGIGGKADKDMAVQIALANGDAELARKILAGEVDPKTVATTPKGKVPESKQGGYAAIRMLLGLTLLWISMVIGFVACQDDPAAPTVEPTVAVVATPSDCAPAERVLDGRCCVETGDGGGRAGTIARPACCGITHEACL